LAKGVSQSAGIVVFQFDSKHVCTQKSIWFRNQQSQANAVEYYLFIMHINDLVHFLPAADVLPRIATTTEPGNFGLHGIRKLLLEDSFWYGCPAAA
jgi:hypothetical protein